MNKGLDSELDYPYIAEDYDPCWTAAANRTIATLTNWTSLPNGSEPSLIWYYNFMERNSNPVFLPFDLSLEEGEIRPFIKTARDEQTQGQGKRTHKRPRACVCMNTIGLQASVLSRWQSTLPTIFSNIIARESSLASVGRSSITA